MTASNKCTYKSLGHHLFSVLFRLQHRSQRVADDRVSPLRRLQRRPSRRHVFIVLAVHHLLRRRGRRHRRHVCHAFFFDSFFELEQFKKPYRRDDAEQIEEDARTEPERGIDRPVPL